MVKKIKPLFLALGTAGLLGAGGYGLYALGMKHGMGMAAPAEPAKGGNLSSASGLPQTIAQGEDATRRHIRNGIKAGDTDPVNGRKVLYYHDPMVPGNKFDKPAKSPFMDMMLVPVYAEQDGANDSGKVAVSPRMQQSLGVRTAEVVEGMLSPQISAVGSIAFNERNQAFVQARAIGYIERLHVRAALDKVAKGQALVDIYVPDWVAAQEEFLSVRRMQGAGLSALVDAARQRMRQAGMGDEQIARVESSGVVHPRTTLAAPIGGVVVDLNARDGMTVMPGATLFRINGLGSVWANAEIPESQAALIRPGAKVEARSSAAPGTVLQGTVQAVLPDVNSATRTIKARVELANPSLVLVPGMQVTMQFSDLRAGKSLLVPSEAVIQTGKRVVVMLAEDKGRFRAVEIETGIESNGQTEIRRGLQAGQRVVVSSQFLIDSEASLKGVEARLNSGATEPLVKHRGEGKVVAIDKDSALLQHGPLPTVGMGAMTMEFKAPAEGMPPRIAKGDRVHFEFVLPKDGEPTLTGITPLASAPISSAPRAGASR